MAHPLLNGRPEVICAPRLSGGVVATTKTLHFLAEDFSMTTTRLLLLSSLLGLAVPACGAPDVPNPEDSGSADSGLDSTTSTDSDAQSYGDAPSEQTESATSDAGTVDASDGATVDASDGATVDASDGATVDASDGGTFLDGAGDACSTPGTEACVPVSQGTLLGVQVAVNAACPAGYDATQPILLGQGVSGGTDCTGCSCSLTQHCSTTFKAYPSKTACTGTLVTLASLNEASQCVPLPAGHSGLPHVDPFVYSAQCTAAGMPLPSGWAWTMSTKFCPANTVVAGCTPGTACVPATGQVCELGGGACSGGFSPVSGGTWYKNALDQRTCGACQCGTSGGDCSNSLVFEHPAGGCPGTEFTLNQGDRCDGFGETSQFSTADLSPNYNAAACSTSAPLSGAIVPTEAATLCCD
jgi:hypothetical protein